MMESLIPDLGAYGVRRERTGGRMQGIAPSNAYVCGDGFSVVISGNADGIFAYHLHFDLSKTTVLETQPWHWPKMNRTEVRANYVDPLDFILNHRPEDR